MKSEDRRNRRLTEGEKRILRDLASRQQTLMTVGADSNPTAVGVRGLTGKRLAAMVRLRETRPSKVAVSVRLDAQVLHWLKSKGNGHLTRINDILHNLMEAEARTHSDR